MRRATAPALLGRQGAGAYHSRGAISAPCLAETLAKGEGSPREPDATKADAECCAVVVTSPVRLLLVSGRQRTFVRRAGRL